MGSLGTSDTLTIPKLKTRDDSWDYLLSIKMYTKQEDDDENKHWKLGEI